MRQSQWISILALLILVGTVSAMQQSPEKKEGKTKTEKLPDGQLPLSALLEEGTYARIDTSMGQFLVKLDKENMPLTVDNFSKIAEGKTVLRDKESGELISRWFYRGMKVCRVYPDKAIQTGCPKGDGTGVKGFFLDSEAKPEMEITTGSLFMLPQKNKVSGSMFAIACAPMSALKGKAPVFGQVVYGLEVVHDISKVPFGFRQTPEKDVIVQRVCIIPIYPESKVTVKKALEAIRPQALSNLKKGGTPTQIHDGGLIEKVEEDGHVFRNISGMPGMNISNALGTPAETRLNPMLLMELKGLQQEHRDKKELERKLKELRDRSRNNAQDGDSEFIKGVERATN